MAECGLYIRPEFLRLDLNPNTLLILAEIDQIAKSYGSCWALNKHFYSRFRISDKTVTKALKTLQEKGLIARDSHNNWTVKVGETPVKVVTSPVGETPILVVHSPSKVGETPAGVGETPAPTEQDSNKKRTKKNTPLSPDEERLGRMLAELRTREARLQRTAESSVQFYGERVIRPLLEESDVDTVEFYIHWLANTAAGRESFSFGGANMKGNYTHVLVRNFGGNMQKARNPRAPQQIKANYDGTCLDGSHDDL